MHGVKVYLKSGRDRLYRAMVVLSGGLLLSLAYLLFAHDPADWLIALLYGASGLGLTGHSLLEPKVRRKWRYLPTLLLLAVAVHLAWMLTTQASSATFLSPVLTWTSAIFLTVLACAGPMTVGTRFAYFSPRRIYIRYSIFKRTEFKWDKVQTVQLEDDFLEIALHKGKDIRLVPSYRHTQHLRSYLHEISLKAQSKDKKAQRTKDKEARRDQMLQS